VKCLTFSLAAEKIEGELLIIEKNEILFKTLHFGPLEETADGFKYILVVIDACTKYVWLFATKSTGSNEVISSLTSLPLQHRTLLQSCSNIILQNWHYYSNIANLAARLP